MSQAESLLQLQELELAIIRGQKRIAEITAILANDEQIAQAQAQVHGVQQVLTPLRAKARNLELEMQSNTEKVQTTEKQLYSGKVKNTKEMQDMQAEIASIRKRNTEIEETLLETMMLVEEQEAALVSADSALKATVGERASEKRHLVDEQATLQSQVSGLRKQREAAMQSIDPSALAKYNALRPKKNNHPVAILRENTCGACGVEQTMAIEREARIGQSLATCLSCGRILVYK